MNKKFIITALLALIAFAGRSQVFTPVKNDSIDFVIEGTASGADTILLKERPYTQSRKYPVRNGRFRISIRQPLHKFLQIEDGKGGWMVLIVDNQPARAVIDFRTNRVVKGSPLNQRFNRYRLALDTIETELMEHEEDADRTVADSLERQVAKSCGKPSRKTSTMSFPYIISPCWGSSPCCRLSNWKPA